MVELVLSTSYIFFSYNKKILNLLNSSEQQLHGKLTLKVLKAGAVEKKIPHFPQANNAERFIN